MSDCKKVLIDNLGNIVISDFSLHSIGVILFRFRREKIFGNFIQDVLPNIELVTLSGDGYKDLSKVSEECHLDFDDAYQFKTAEENTLTIVTMDRHFERVKDRIEVLFV